MDLNDTIYGFATGESVSGLAVLRASGDRCAAILETMIGDPPVPRMASLRVFRHSSSGDSLDTGIMIWFPGPGSFTGEDCLEFHCHGSLAVRAAILGSLSAIEGCRLAWPGEFTRRAFQNGKMDLTEVEGLSELLGARTEQQRVRAVAMLDGRLSECANGWRADILAVYAEISACIDFSEEEDVSEQVIGQAITQCGVMSHAMDEAVDRADNGEIVRSGFRVVLCGPTNSGKSSLLNALAKRDVAIVSDIEGTTRDLLEVELDLGGLFVRVADGAGLRDSEDVIENLGILRSIDAAAKADLVLWLAPVDAAVEVDQRISEVAANLIVVNTKTDLAADVPVYGGIQGVSVRSGAGLSELEAVILKHARAGVRGLDDGLAVNERQRLAIVSASNRLRKVCSATSSEDLEVLAEELSGAVYDIGSITGHIDVEEMLGNIFSRFCIGK